MNYVYPIKTADKWLYTGIEPSVPRMFSEEGPLPLKRPQKMAIKRLFDLIEDEGIRTKKGRLGFGHSKGGKFNDFLDISFDDREEKEDGISLANYDLGDGDTSLLLMPKKKVIVPCQISASCNGISAEAPEVIDERCFVLGEDQQLVTASLNPNGSNQIKIIPKLAFISWVRPTMGILPRFAVKSACELIEISDSKRNKKYTTMAQTSNIKDEVSAISRLLNLIGLSAIVGKYPLRKKDDENYGS